MKTRILTGLAILAFIIPALYLGGWLLFTLIACIIIFGGFEYLNVVKKEEEIPLWVKLVTILSLFILLFASQKLSIAMIGILILFYLSLPVFITTFNPKDAFLCISCIIFFYIIGSSFMVIYETNPLYIWLIIIATYTCDTAAYFTGYFLGKHKLNERISPKKTIEGSIGGWLIGGICSFAFAYFYIPELSIIAMLAAAIILPISGQIGDLAFSAMKRCYGIKDFSNLLPGHGGVLDRLDSLIFNFICFHMILVVILL